MTKDCKCPVDLSGKKCVPCCDVGADPLKGKALEGLLETLSSDWKVIEDHHLERSFKFKNFKEALAFVNKVGALAEEQGHHPDICLAWGRVKVTLWTHKIDGLHESDFIMAAKIDKL
jgi:4a-hydroxytetrahydrobiopterin dehydratase